MIKKTHLFETDMKGFAKKSFSEKQEREREMFY